MNAPWAKAPVARAPSALRSRYGEAALVTGASDGIGRAFAELLAAEGFDLILVARRADRLHQMATSLSTRHLARVTVLPLDLSTAAAHAHLLEATSGLPIGLLIAAAGYGTSGPLLDASLDTELDMLAVNCASTLRLAHAMGRRFSSQRRGGIVLMSSLLAFQGVPRAAHYAATKAYVQVLAEGLHRELAPHGVDVIAAAPGPVHSGFAGRAKMRMAMALQPETVARGTLAALGRRPTTRPGWLSWLLEASLAPLPRRGRTMVLQQVMAGMTASVDR